MKCSVEWAGLSSWKFKLVSSGKESKIDWHWFPIAAIKNTGLTDEGPYCCPIAAVYVHQLWESSGRENTYRGLGKTYQWWWKSIWILFARPNSVKEKFGLRRYCRMVHSLQGNQKKNEVYPSRISLAKMLQTTIESIRKSICDNESSTKNVRLCGRKLLAALVLSAFFVAIPRLELEHGKVHFGSSIKSFVVPTVCRWKGRRKRISSGRWWTTK